MTLALGFESTAATDPAFTGGKGANLARLTQADLPVPPGFVIAAQAYDAYAATARAILDRSATLATGDAARLEAQCLDLQSALTRIPMPPEVAREIRHALEGFPDRTAFSVRSSSTTEDLGGAAFAGQHETYLNCIGADEIIARVKDCWVSLWSGRAVAYRNEAKFDIGRSSMAVVVQKMVFCDVAGVGFSLNPIDGNLSEQVFDANYGLGESVVSGEVEIDHFTVNKENGLILSQEIAEKSMKIVARPDGLGTLEVSLDDGERLAPCLSAAQVRELSALLRQVERLYGYPQDIEWGFADGTLWLLQSRPITRIAARWTRDESAERFPSVITPLAWALVEEGFHRSLNFSFALMGMPPFKDKWFAMFDHYIYGNQSAVEIYANGAASSIQIHSLPELVAAIPLLRKQYAWVQELPLTWSRDLDHYLISLGELMAEPLDRKSTAELWEYVLRVKELGADYFLPNIAISITQRTLYRILLALLEMTVGKARAAPTFDRLLAYCETKTGAINKELYRLAQKMLATPSLVDRLHQADSRAFIGAGGFSAWPEIDRIFKKFLRDHGHREVEFDPYHATWLEAPWLVIDNLRLMLDSRVDDPADKELEHKVAMRETEDALIGALPAEIRFFVHEIIRLARVYTSLDDIEHYQTTRLTLPFRRGLRALGGRLVDIGLLEEPMDIFFAQYRELDAAVKSTDPADWQALGLAIAAEKGNYLKHQRETPPDQPGQSIADDFPNGDEMTGLAGSPGCARGPVYKIFSSDDFAGFPKGAVLVARTTNPAWTPLFYKASAVITESGGPLSHGAVTAREVGLPAVMSVKGALARLENGQQVSVDGSRGRVSFAEDWQVP